MEKENNGSLFYTIPAEIMHDTSLNHAEKLTMGLLNGLAKRDGSCYCSNDWLCSMLGVKLRTIQDILENLEKNNYIKREIVSCVSNPFKKIRTIYVCANFKISLRHAENRTSGNAENRVDDMRKTAHIIDTRELIEEEEKESSRALAKEKGTSAPPAPPNPPLTHSFFEQGEVKMEQKKLEKLYEEYGTSRVMDYIERLDDYAKTKKKKFKEYSCHAAVIRTWMKRDGMQKIAVVPYKTTCRSQSEEKNIFALELERQENSRSPKKLNDFEWFCSLECLIPLQRQHKIINYKDCVEFPDVPEAKFRYEEHGFREKVINTLRKMNVDVNSIKL